MKTRDFAPSGVKEVINSYQKSTINELWDSSEEIIENYQNETEYKKLLSGKEGINVIQFHHTLVISKFMEDWTENVIRIAQNMIKEKNNFDQNLEKKFQSIADYCRGITFNIVGKDRLASNFECNIDYNISKWLEDNSGLLLDDFKFDKSSKIVFKISEEQYEVVQNEIERYGESTSGMTKAITHLSFQFLLRKPTMLIQT